MECGRRMDIGSNAYFVYNMYINCLRIHRNMREEQHETGAKYRIIIECDDINTRTQWWELLMPYIEYLEKVRFDLFEQEGWRIQKDWKEE